VTQVLGPEFKPQYHTHTHTQKQDKQKKKKHEEVFNFPGYKRDANQKYT
jgi:hypothetical protein